MNLVDRKEEKIKWQELLVQILDQHMFFQNIHVYMYKYVLKLNKPSAYQLTCECNKGEYSEPLNNVAELVHVHNIQIYSCTMSKW